MLMAWDKEMEGSKSSVCTEKNRPESGKQCCPVLRQPFDVNLLTKEEPP